MQWSRCVCHKAAIASRCQHVRGSASGARTGKAMSFLMYALCTNVASPPDTISTGKSQGASNVNDMAAEMSMMNTVSVSFAVFVTRPFAATATSATATAARPAYVDTNS